MTTAPQADEMYVRYPPGRRNILLPCASRDAFSLGMSLYAPSGRGVLVAQRALWLLARVGGPRLVPGPRVPWVDVLPKATFERLWQDWTAAAGRPLDGVALYERPQSAREVVVLLVSAGPRSMLIRLRRDGRELALERRVSELARDLTSSFTVPALISSGASDGWHWVGYEAMSRAPHFPFRGPTGPLEREVTDLVERAVDRPVGVPAHWRGAHGDLAPWNLRTAGGRTWLIDWEDCGYAPPGTDALYIAATRAAIEYRPARPLALLHEYEEAAEMWIDIVRRRIDVEGSSRLNERLLTVLGGRR